MECGENSDTPLLAFFKANQRPGPIGNFARSLTYQEFPEQFTLKSVEGDSHSKTWSHRQTGFAIGRMIHVGPTAGEKFYLRTLLMVVKGPTSFEDLRTVDGVLCGSFHEACLKRGLLEDDGEWRLCLQDAAEIQTGSQLRHLFTTLLLFCAPTTPKDLWLEFRPKICDDLRHRLHDLGRTSVTEEEVYDFGLHLINDILGDSGHTLLDFPNMAQTVYNWFDTVNNRLISQQLNYNHQAEHDMATHFIASLNGDQRHVFEIIWDSIINKQGRLFFIDGWGGCGKTYLYETLCHAIRAQGLIILCVASTGLACLLLPGGQTAHSTFKIPIDNLDEYSICSIPKESLRADLLRSAHAIFYDESLMTHRHCFEALDRTFQDLRNCAKPFGGLTMVFGGDFQQILPVIPRGSRTEIVDACLQSSYLWNRMEVLKLRENMRLQNSPEDALFASWLLDIGHGTDVDEKNKVLLPQQIVTYDEDELIQRIYGDIGDSDEIPPPTYFLDHAILAPRNVDVQGTNAKILTKMPGEPIVYHSADSLEIDNLQQHPDDVPDDMLRALDPSSLPLSELMMKIGCPLMLLRNLDPKKGLCNGTRMILLRAYPRVLEVMIIGGDHHGQKAFIPRISLKPSSRQYAFVLKRRQFPVRLCFAMTINKSQGQSLKHVGIHLLSPVFCHGQLYVALSRATSGKDVHILLPKDCTTTVNIVYSEVLID